MVVYERIPDDLTGTYWSGQQKAKVTADHVTFTLVDPLGNMYKRVYAPVGSGSGSDPFAQPDGNGVFVVDINHDTSTLTYLDNMLRNVSPSLKYDMYTQDTQFVFMPTNIFSVPSVIGSPATGRVPTYEFTVNLEGHLVTFTLGTSYLSPVPFPDFSHSPSTNMGETTGQNSARSATGGQGAANTGTSSRGVGGMIVNAGGGATRVESGTTVTEGAGEDAVGAWGAYDDMVARHYINEDYKTNPPTGSLAGHYKHYQDYDKMVQDYYMKNPLDPYYKNPP